MPPTTGPTLPPGTRLGAVHLRVADLHGVVEFYQEVLGMEVLAEDAATAALGEGPGMPPLLVLHAAGKGGSAPTPGSPGLYHVAFRVPGRGGLGALIRRIREAGWRFQGFADHNVSEAAYLSDPEGNGIEIYADRDPDVWRTVDGEIFMTTEPLDLEGLLAVAARPAPGLPSGTVNGHIHLRVSSLREAEEFYVGTVGLGVVTRRIAGALFVAADGYHHHVGLNVWTPATAPRRQGDLGLMSFELVVPDEDSRRRITGGVDEGLLLDPDHIDVRICRPDDTDPETRRPAESDPAEASSS